MGGWSRARRLAPWLLAAAALFSCGPPRIRITWTQPARLALPHEVPVAVEVDAGPSPDGREIANQVVSAFVLRRKNRFAPVEPLKAAFAEVLAQQGYRLVPAAEAGLLIRVRPTAWHFDMDPQRMLIGGTGRLDAAIEVVDPKSPAAPIFKEAYWATSTVGAIGETGALDRTARRVANMLLSETRPGQMAARVVLDDSDPVVQTGLELCRQNQFGAAYEAFARAVTQAPGSAAAQYNFGVMAEIQGLYDIAENSVRKATQLQPKPLYFTALERIRQARTDSEGMRALQGLPGQPGQPAQQGPPAQDGPAPPAGPPAQQDPQAQPGPPPAEPPPPPPP